MSPILKNPETNWIVAQKYKARQVVVKVIIPKTFYIHYKQGNSFAKALQKAALELIRNKSDKFHEPYYWANFTLSGDYS